MLPGTSTILLDVIAQLSLLCLNRSVSFTLILCAMASLDDESSGVVWKTSRRLILLSAHPKSSPNTMNSGKSRVLRSCHKPREQYGLLLNNVASMLRLAPRLLEGIDAGDRMVSAIIFPSFIKRVKTL